MDGLSAAAGVVGVLSLAMQLSEAAFVLVRFLDTVADAPSEVIRLKDLLKLVHVTSIGIKSALDSQQRLNTGSIPSTEPIQEAMEICARKLTLIQKALSRVENIERGCNLVSRSWARFRLAIKKDQIAEVESQLGQALNVLNVLLTTNLIHSSSRSTLLLVDKFNEAGTGDDLHQRIMQQNAPSEMSLQILFRSDIPVSFRSSAKDGDILNPRGFEIQGRRAFTTVTRSTSTQVWHSRVGKLGVSTREMMKTIEEENGSRTEFQKRSTKYWILPSFLSWSLELVINQSASSTPVYSLTIGHVISWKDRRLEAIFKDDDVRHLQQMLSNAELKISTSTDTGWTLLKIAEYRRCNSIATFLIEQGCTIRPGTARETLCSYTEGSLANHFELVCSRLDLAEIEPYDVIPPVNCTYDGCAGIQVLFAIEYLSLAGLRQTILQPARYLGLLLCMLCQWWLKAANAPKRRDDLARDLIKRGADINCFDRHGRTPLQNFDWNEIEGDGSAMISYWLGLLKNCEVNVAQYLFNERYHSEDGFEPCSHDRPWAYDCITPRKFNSWPQPSAGETLKVECWIDPETSVGMLLREFHFCSNFIIQDGGGCHTIKPWLDTWGNDYKNRPLHEGRKKIADLMVKWRQDREHSLGKFTNGSASDNKEQCSHDWSERNSDLDPKLQEAPAQWIIDHPQFPRWLCDVDAYGNYIDLWPFHGRTHTLCQSGNKLKEGCLRLESGSDWCDVHACRFNHTRFARKQVKKMAKRMKIEQGIKPAKEVIPGAWDD